jgi:hypothetical protein
MMISAVLAASFGASGCGEAAARSAERFCGELAAHSTEIQTPPTEVDEIPALITLYSKMGEVAPLEIEADWVAVYGSLKTAATVEVDEPFSVDAANRAAYSTQASAVKVVQWAQDRCGLTLQPAGIAPGGAPVAQSTTTTVESP